MPLNNLRGAVLVNMPFASYKQPSLALSLLKASLAPLGLPVHLFYFTLSFAKQIGANLYNRIAAWPVVDLLGDWIFAVGLFARNEKAERAYLREVLAGGDPAHTSAYFGKEPPSPAMVEELLDVRLRVSAFLDSCTEQIIRQAPLVVGFTSLFHQQTASLALARCLKEKLPEAFLVLGGASCQGPMGAELLRQFPFLDAVVPGEGEAVFPAIMRKVHRGEAIGGLPGVLLRDPVPVETTLPLLPFDALPTPDFSDFLTAWQDTGFPDKGAPRFPIEASRGCWWGEKARCAFCGQASIDLHYRVKAPDRVLVELARITQSVEKESGAAVFFTDEIIPEIFFRSVLPRISWWDKGTDCRQESPKLLSEPEKQPGLPVVYFQIRPDLSKERLAQLPPAGIVRIEAGVENLSTEVLRQIGKGVSALQNLRFLKWCRELRIDTVWNWLWGFPDESAEEYGRMAKLVPWITHLQPPHYAGPFRLDRFSPLFECAEQWGLREVHPYPAYRCIYPFSDPALANLAYSFTYMYAQPQPVATYTEPLAKAIDDWKVHANRAYLFQEEEGEQLLLFDHRDPRRPEQVTALDGMHRLALLACAEIRCQAELAHALEGGAGHHLAEGELVEIMQPLLAEGWIVQEGEKYLSLTVPFK